MFMNKWNELAWPSTLANHSLQELGDEFRPDWLCCEKACRDYHAFFGFYISLHLIDKDDFMTPGNLLRTMEKSILSHLSNSPASVNALLIGSASEQSAAQVCAALEDWFPGIWSLTVLDRCATPLNRIREHLGGGIQLIHENFAEYQPDGRTFFDLIIGDCILEFNTSDNRQKILQAVSKLLSDSGIYVMRERTGNVSDAMNIGQESEHLVEKAKDIFLQQHIPLGAKEIELIRSRSYRFLLQILDSHNAYDSKETLEKDLSRYFTIVDRQILDNVSRELIYHYYLLGKMVTYF